MCFDDDAHAAIVGIELGEGFLTSRARSAVEKLRDTLRRAQCRSPFAVAQTRQMTIEHAARVYSAACAKSLSEVGAHSMHDQQLQRAGLRGVGVGASAICFIALGGACGSQIAALRTSLTVAAE